MKALASVLAVVLAVVTFCTASLPATAQESSQKKSDMLVKMELLRSLQFQTGEISILGGKAKIKLTDDFRFLDPANSRKVIVDIWGNPPEVGSVTGMVVPKGFLETEGWGAVLNWSDVGYVKDAEYDGIDFNKMLEKLKEESGEESKQRQASGYGQMLLTGWATPPRYDKQAHKLFWAKAYDVGRPVQGLNYDIRVLGRGGVIELSVVSGMSDLAGIEAKVPEILSMVDFSDGNRYADFKPGTDKVAAYGIAGLIAGGVLAKAGFFKLIWVGLLAAKKFVIIAVVAIGAWIKKLLGARKQA